MNSSIVILATVGLVGTCLLVGLIFWVTRASSKKAVAENETKSLRKGQEAHSRADKVMSEPVAYEPAWLRRARQRVYNRDSES